MIQTTTNGNGKSPANPEIKLLIFDMGGVIVRFEWDIVCKGFAQIAGVSLESFKEKLKEINKPHYEKGQMTTNQLIERLNEAFALQLTENEFHLLWNATLDEDLQMAELLQELRQQIPLYLLSNINDSHYRYVEDTFNVSRHFKELILSYEVGYIKPEPEIYHEVLKRSGLAPHHCLFIDDLKVNVEAAHALGIKAIQFTGIDDLRPKLNKFGIMT